MRSKGLHSGIILIWYGLLDVLTTFYGTTFENCFEGNLIFFNLVRRSLIDMIYIKIVATASILIIIEYLVRNNHRLMYIFFLSFVISLSVFAVFNNLHQIYLFKL